MCVKMLMHEAQPFACLSPEMTKLEVVRLINRVSEEQRCLLTPSQCTNALAWARVLRRTREKTGLPVAKAANKAGINVVFLELLERGVIAPQDVPTEVLDRLSAVYEIDRDDLVTALADEMLQAHNYDEDGRPLSEAV